MMNFFSSENVDEFDGLGLGEMCFIAVIVGFGAYITNEIYQAFYHRREVVPVPMPRIVITPEFR